MWWFVEVKNQSANEEDNRAKSDADKLKLDRRANDFLERSSEFEIREKKSLVTIRRDFKIPF